MLYIFDMKESISSGSWPKWWLVSLTQCVGTGRFRSGIMIPLRIQMNAFSISTWLAEELSGAAYLRGPSFADPKRGL